MSGRSSSSRLRFDSTPIVASRVHQLGFHLHLVNRRGFASQPLTYQVTVRIQSTHPVPASHPGLIARPVHYCTHPLPLPLLLHPPQRRTPAHRVPWLRAGRGSQEPHRYSVLTIAMSFGLAGQGRRIPQSTGICYSPSYTRSFAGRRRCPDRFPPPFER